MYTCDEFMVSRIDNPLADPICERCGLHRRQHSGSVAADLNRSEDIMAAQPLPSEILKSGWGIIESTT